MFQTFDMWYPTDCSFGFILFDGTISHFLKKSAGMEVQLQAVRIVQILLHCKALKLWKWLDV